MRWWLRVEQFLQDLRYGVRIAGRNRGFTAVAILTLALGVGANTAIFSILNAQLWRPLPFPDSERLVDAHAVLRNNPRQWDVLSSRSFAAWRAQSRSFAGLAGYDYPAARNLTTGGASERVLVMAVTANLFATLEMPVQRGRGFLDGEETPGHDGVAIVSDAFWRNRLASEADALGKPIHLDGRSYTVVGIASRELQFQYIDEPDVLVPLVLAQGRVSRNLYTIGRLAPGMTEERARGELTAILEREMKAEGSPSEDTAAVTSLRRTWTGFAARPLYFIAGPVVLVLMIALTNTAGLLLARGLAREREFAVRAALGAARGRLLRQSLAESLILATGAAVVGTILGMWAAPLAQLLPSDAAPRHAPVSLDARVVLFTVALSIVSALLLGLAPAILTVRRDLAEAAHGVRNRSASSSQRRSRSILLASEVALGCVLLFGTGLLFSTVMHLETAPRGFDAPGALSFRVSLRGDNYAKPEQIERYYSQLTERLGSLAGVRAVTLGSGLPLTGSTALFANVNAAGRPAIGPHGLGVVVHAVAPNYFQALGMRVLAGHSFSREDASGAARVAIVNRNMARTLFGTENPLGKLVEFAADARRGVPQQAPVEIVGVTENAQEFGADEVPFSDLYVPFLQRPVASAYVVVASGIPRGVLAASIRAAAYALDKDQPVYDLKTMDDRVADSFRRARFNLFLMGSLSGLALLLVSIGIFGTAAYFVEQRTQEFGIRLALGASPAGILRNAIGQSLATGVAGVTIGVAASLILARMLQHALYLAPHEHTGILYGVKVYDPLSIGAACVLLIVVLLAASYVPARRAMRVDPMVALRYE